MNSEELLQTVIKVITNVPVKELKKNFVRHCSTTCDAKLIKSVHADWKRFKDAYAEFQAGFGEDVESSVFLQKVLVQLATVSALMGKINPAVDELGVYAGCALFVSEWCQDLGQRLFPGCPWYTFYAIWSPFLNTFGVDWGYHGPSQTVLLALEQNVGDEDDSNDELDFYVPIFPGPAPCMEVGSSNVNRLEGSVISWDKHFGTITSSSMRNQFNLIFGLPARSKKLSSKQITYFNPSDNSFTPHRGFSKTWTIDVLAAAPDIAEFEEGVEEDTGAFDADMSKLQAMLAEVAIEPESVPVPVPEVYSK
jgi:hypothetical protein